MINFKKVVFFSFMFLMMACSEPHDPKEILGTWTITECNNFTDVSGELILNESGQGAINIYRTSDSIVHELFFSKVITDLEYEHHEDPVYSGTVHWYNGYFNENITFSFESIDRKTK